MSKANYISLDPALYAVFEKVRYKFECISRKVFSTIFNLLRGLGGSVSPPAFHFGRAGKFASLTNKH